jgi:OPA family glycerol-3-phosphate transporter-like MFS transporter/OPA family sugar phosphate sensor protein UhpC-like MFS transporter
MSIEAPARVDSGSGVFGWFRPDPPAAAITDPEQIRREYRRGQIRALGWALVGYAMFYFVRKNLSIAMPVMGKELGIGKAELGIFLTLHGVIYGVSKFVNGFLGDRANARTFLAAGLILSAACNLWFGLSSTALMLGLAWMLNGWFQGMGFPPCARLMTHWFSPRELATKMSIWNTSHSIGAGAIVVLCGYLVGFSWRLCFIVPAALAVFAAIVMLFTLPDTPASVGLPEVEGTGPAAEEADARRVEATERVGELPASAVLEYETPREEAAFGAFVRKRVFGNPFIWIIAVANFFVYAVRYAMLDWGPTFLSEAKGIKLSHAGWMVATFEISGVVGMLFSGWLTDRVFGGRGARTCFFSMIGTIGAMLLLWKFPGHSAWAYTVILCMAGFFIYGPQALVGIAVANLATKRAAATAVGLTGIFGYASTVLSGWGLGLLVQRYGWDRGFMAMMVVAVMGTVCFALAWPARAHGYGEKSETRNQNSE